MKSLVWIFPIIFILHDFEEMILVCVWKKRYAAVLTGSSKEPYNHFETTDSFCVGVLLILLIYTLISFISFLTGWYYVWAGLLMGFLLHFTLHIKQNIQFKHYVPGIFTAVFFTPACIYLLWRLQEVEKYPIGNLIIAWVACTLFTLILFKPLTKIIKPVHLLLDKYAQGK